MQVVKIADKNAVQIAFSGGKLPVTLAADADLATMQDDIALIKADIAAIRAILES